MIWMINRLRTHNDVDIEMTGNYSLNIWDN